MRKEAIVYSAWIIGSVAALLLSPARSGAG
jgi:hypothetical protein